jgi:hypothetical protein
MKMPDFVTLTCPTCGGKLQITADIERFACGYCGNEHIVRRGGGIISLIPVAEDIKGIKISVDKTAAELAISRIKGEIEEINNKYALMKRQKLSSRVNEDGILGTCVNGFLSLLGIHQGKRHIEKNFDLKTNANIFISLCDDDIKYSLIHWNELWSQIDLKNTDVLSVYGILNEIKKIMDEKEELLLQKEAELNRLKQLVSS